MTDKQYPSPAELDLMIASKMADKFLELMPGLDVDRTTLEAIMVTLFKCSMEKLQDMMRELGPPPSPMDRRRPAGMAN